MGESRTELIGWINELLQLNYTKVEQCGTGGAYCQIMDSIYGASPIRPSLLTRLIRFAFCPLLLSGKPVDCT